MWVYKLRDRGVNEKALWAAGFLTQSNFFITAGSSSAEKACQPPPSQAGISPTPETLRLSPGALPCASAYLRPSVFIDVLREQLAARLEWLKRSAAFLPCFQRDHAGSLLATVKAESDHIAARIEAAVRLRNARKPWQPRRGV